MNLRNGEEVIYRNKNFSGLGSNVDSVLNELILTNFRLIGKYSKEEIIIAFDKISQIRLRMEKGSFMGKAIPAFFWFLIGSALISSSGALGLIFFGLSAFFGYLAYRNLEGTTYLYLDMIDGNELHFWEKGKSDALILYKEFLEQNI